MSGSTTVRGAPGTLAHRTPDAAWRTPHDPFASIKAARREGRLLRFAIDGWSLAYLASATAVFVLHWHLPTIQPLLVVIACAMAYGAGCIQHDHAHLPLWRSATLNLLT